MIHFLQTLKDDTYCNSTFFHTLNITQRCGYILNHTDCNSDNGLINFYEFYYCNCNSHWYFAFPVIVIIALVGFYFLGKATQHYLANSLTRIADLLSCNENLAGVTLLAFANGAQDVITTIVASSSGGGDADSSGIYLAIGALVGSATFITGIISSIIVLLSGTKSMKVNKRTFIKDTLCILIALLILFCYSLYGKINTYMSIFFFIVYVGYVIMSFVMKPKEKVEDAEKNEFTENISLALISAKQITQSAAINDSIQSSGSILEKEKQKEFKIDLKENEILEDDEEETLMPWFIEIPSQFLLKCILLPPNEDMWNKIFVCISSLLGGLFFLYSNQIIDGLINLEVFPIVVVSISVILFILGLISRRGLPPSYLGIFIFFSIIFSINFISWISNFIVDFLNILGFVTNLDASFLGITILAFGNCVGDFIADTTMAEKGKGEMAITGTFSSPTFNLLVGLGCSLIITNYKTGKPVPFSIKSISIVQPMMALIAASIIIIHWLVFALGNNCVIHSGIAIRAMIFYAIFLIALSVFSFGFD